MAYVCSSIRYVQICVDESFSRHAWYAPFLSGYAQILPTVGPPFDPWAPPLKPSVVPAPLKDPDFQAEEEED